MRYERAPVIEATIGFQLSPELTPAERSRLRSAFESEFQLADELHKLSVEYGPQGTVTKVEQAGFNLKRMDGSCAVVLSESQLSFSLTEQYKSWEQVAIPAVQMLQKARATIGYKNIVRLGVRYLNRIDIPNEKGTLTSLKKFINLSPEQLVLDRYDYIGYFFSVHVNVRPNVRAHIQTGPTAAALLGHASIVLDIDAYVEGDNISQNPQSIQTMLRELRACKNELFESAITDASRTLFGQMGGGVN